MIAGLGKSAKKFGRRVKPTTNFIKRQKIATETAGVFNAHSENLEQHWKTFSQIDDALAESNAGCVGWLQPDNAEHLQVLLNTRKSANQLIDSIDFALPTLESLRATIINQKGVSQDLNTAIARLSHVLTGLIDAFKKSRSRFQKLIVQIDAKS